MALVELNGDVCWKSRGSGRIRPVVTPAQWHLDPTGSPPSRSGLLVIADVIWHGKCRCCAGGRCGVRWPRTRTHTNTHEHAERARSLTAVVPYESRRALSARAPAIRPRYHCRRLPLPGAAPHEPLPSRSLRQASRTTRRSSRPPSTAPAAQRLSPRSLPTSPLAAPPGRPC